MSSSGYAVVQATRGPESPDVYRNKKEKKMGWFTRWFDRKCREAWERKQDENRAMLVSPVEEPQLAVDGMNIRVYGATGGHIVEFRKYDRHKDRNDNKMYVIPTEQNFTESFSKIVGMEMMR